MGNAPHIRDMITWLGASPPTVTMEVKAGDFLVFLHHNYGTSGRVGSYTTITSNMGGSTGRLSASGTASWSLVACARAANDYTAGLGTSGPSGGDGTVNSGQSSNASYGIAQALIAFDNVEAFQWGSAFEEPFTANAPGAFGRPLSLTDSTPTKTINSGLDVATHHLFFGAAHKAWTGTDTPWVFDPAGEVLFDSYRASSSRNTVLSGRYVECTGEALTYGGSDPETAAKAPIFALNVVCSESGGGEEEDTFHALTMGDGTPVTLEGYWDGTQLLPAEFVGLATA